MHDLLPLLVVWVFGSVLSHETLLDNPYVTADVAWPHPVVVKVGIIMSSLGGLYNHSRGHLHYYQRSPETIWYRSWSRSRHKEEEHKPPPPPVADSPRRVQSRNRLSTLVYLSRRPVALPQSTG